MTIRLLASLTGLSAGTAYDLRSTLRDPRSRHRLGISVKTPFRQDRLLQTEIFHQQYTFFCNPDLSESMLLSDNEIYNTMKPDDDYRVNHVRDNSLGEDASQPRQQHLDPYSHRS